MLVAGAAVLVAAGVPIRLLLPSGWGELGAGVSQGLQTLPDVRVPYAGVDAWPRIVILSGAALLVALAAAVTFWPVRGRGAPGHAAGATLLCVLYAVPAVDLTTSHQFLRGRRLRRAAGRVPVAGARAAERRGRRRRRARRCRRRRHGARARPGPAAGVGGLREDRRVVRAGGASVSFDFSHRYGPLDWPRDGREVLRVKAKRPAYWKAENLDDFDGLRWRASTALARARTPLASELPSNFRNRRQWRQRIEVTIRSLDSTDVIGAGNDARRRASAQLPGRHGEPGTYAFEETLKRGDSYAADVYVPRPSPRQMAAAPISYPELSPRYFALRVPLAAKARRAGLPAEVMFASPPSAAAAPRPSSRSISATRSPSTATPPCAQSVYRADVGAGPAPRAPSSRTPYEYVRRVLAYLADGFAYSESPPRHSGSPGELPVRRRARLLPAVLGRDGAAAAHGRRARAGGGRVRARAASAPSAAST